MPGKIRNSNLAAAIVLSDKEKKKKVNIASAKAGVAGALVPFLVSAIAGLSLAYLGKISLVTTATVFGLPALPFMAFAVLAVSVISGWLSARAAKKATIKELKELTVAKQPAVVAQPVAPTVQPEPAQPQVAATADLTAALDAVTQERNAARAEVEQVKTQLAERTAALEQARQVQAQVQQTLETTQTELRAAQSQSTVRQVQIEDLTAAQTALQQANTAATAEIEKLKTELTQTKERLHTVAQRKSKDARAARDEYLRSPEAQEIEEQRASKAAASQPVTQVMTPVSSPSTDNEIEAAPAVEVVSKKKSLLERIRSNSGTPVDKEAAARAKAEAAEAKAKKRQEAAEAKAKKEQELAEMKAKKKQEAEAKAKAKKEEAEAKKLPKDGESVTQKPGVKKWLSRFSKSAPANVTQTAEAPTPPAVNEEAVLAVQPMALTTQADMQVAVIPRTDSQASLRSDNSQQSRQSLRASAV